MPRRRKIISVGASSKKAGKSKVAAHLVRSLKAGGALKVSSGAHAPSSIVTDPETLARPGTDTAALLQAGAGKVIWVNAPPSRLAIELERALGMFPPGGTLVIEGNSALAHVDADFSVFLMSVPFEQFKPSAEQALGKADLVLADLRWSLKGERKDSIGAGIAERIPGAQVIYYSDEPGFASALERTTSMARRALA